MININENLPPAQCLPRLLLCMLWLVLAFAPGAQAEPELSMALVEQRLGTLRDSGSVNDSEVMKAYEKVKGLLIEMDSQDRDAANYADAMITAPQRQAKIQARIDATEEQAQTDENLGQLPTAELDARLAVARTELAEANNSQITLDRRLAGRETSYAKLQSRLGEITSRMDSLPDATLVIDPGGQPSEAEAQQWSHAVEYLALRAERRAIEARLASQQVRFSAMAVERAEVVLIAERLSRLVTELEGTLASQVTEALDAAAMGMQADDPAYALANQMAAADTELRQESIAVNEKLLQARRQKEDIDRQARALEDQFATTRRVVDFASDSDVLGSILLAYWREVDKFQPSDSTADLSREAAGTVIRRIELEQSLKELSSASGYINRQLEINGIAADMIPAASRAGLLELVNAYRERLRTVIAAQSDYIDTLSAFGGGYQTLTGLLGQYEAYLSSLILWIPAYPALWAVDYNSAPAELTALGMTLREIRLSVKPGLLFGVLAFILLLSQRSRLQAYEQKMNALTSRPRDDSIKHTLLTLVCIALRALTVPVLLAGIAAALSPASLALTLSFTAAALFLMQLMRYLCEPAGAGTVHFGWRAPVIARIHQELGRLIRWWLPLSLVVLLIAFATLDSREAIIARWALVAFTMLPLMLLTNSLVKDARSSGALWSTDISNRVRLVLITILAAIAIALLLGHFYSVSVFLTGLNSTVWIGVCLLLLHAVLIRWVTVTRRRLRLAELMEARKAQHGTEDPLSEEKKANLGDVSAETNELINMGILVAAALSLFYVWSPLLPAFDALSKITLWTSTTVMVDGQIAENRISLAMLVIVTLLASLTIYATRKLPALIDLLLLGRTNVSPSARYTVSALVKYIIIGGGIVAALSALGLQWSQLQWLVAALGVGIGFGLQEIIANFISGLIILFERPIRVGDVISTGGNDGMVTRIRIRATTIRDWDGKELLVPNKEFITGRLLNWSLSDPKIRTVLPVGIAYGSDVELAIRTLYDIVRVHPRVVDDPEPQIVFESFGDNALALSARCFLDSLENRMAVVTELNREIYKRFEQEGIVIAFPQRDIHLDTDKPIRIELAGDPVQETQQ